MVVAIFGAIACATQALSPPLAVPDYISELPQLPHCKDSTFKNVGAFSVSRVRCGCNDDEEKVGKHLGHTYIGPWKVKVYSAYCVPEGTAKEPIMCNQMMPLKCAKPGLSGPSKCGACGCDCTFVSVVAKNPPRLRHKKKRFFDELEDEQIGWNEDPYDDDFDEIDNRVGTEPLLCHSRRGRNCGYLEYYKPNGKVDMKSPSYSSWRSDHPRGSYGGNRYDEDADENVGDFHATRARIRSRSFKQPPVRWASDENVGGGRVYGEYNKGPYKAGAEYNWDEEEENVGGRGYGKPQFREYFEAGGWRL